MLLLIFSLIDIFAGFSLSMQVSMPTLLGYAMLIKGSWTFITSFIKDFGFMILGIIDFLAGVGLLFNFSPGLFTVIGIALLGKGIWSLITSFI